MGFNYRKSINLGKGLRVNLSKSGPSISLGKKGMRFSVNSRGTVRGTAGIPGSGMSYSKQLNLKNLIMGWFGLSKEKPGEADKDQAASKVDRPTTSEDYRLIHRVSDETVDWQEILTSQDETTEDGRYTKELAEGVLRGDDDSWLKVIEEMQPFADLTEYGSDFEVGMTVEDFMGITFNIHSDEVVPREVVTYLKSGKESVKPMGIKKRNELIRDYAASVTFRIARDLFALLPVETIVVNAEETELDPATGHNVEWTLLSIIFHRNTFEKLNFEGIDPYEALVNFEHAIDFKVTRGLQPVLPLK